MIKKLYHKVVFRFIIMELKMLRNLLELQIIFNLLL